jgi:hypothetical protein
MTDNDKTLEFIKKSSIIHQKKDGSAKYIYLKTAYGKNNNTKVTITCRKHGDFEQAPSSHLSKSGCSKCGKLKAAKKLRRDAAKKNPFSAHKNAQYYDHDKNEYPINEIALKSTLECWFKCYCKHSFKATIHHISNGTWCPYCANRQLCDDINCTQCLEKSFESCWRKIYWAPTNDTVPRKCFKCSLSKHDFICVDCNETYSATLQNISKGGHHWFNYIEWFRRCS